MNNTGLFSERGEIRSAYELTLRALSISNASSGASHSLHKLCTLTIVLFISTVSRAKVILKIALIKKKINIIKLV